MKQLSIVILTCNQKELTFRCLKSLEQLLIDGETEIIIVDNGSSDHTREMVTKEFPDVRYITNPQNLGVAAGRNRGIQKSEGEYIMILDNDTVASKESIESLVDYLKLHPEIGVIAPRLIGRDGRVQKSWKDFPGLGVKIANVLSKGRKDHVSDREIDKDIEPFYVIGAAQLFHRKVWEETGPLDEKIFYGPEDADFCMRVRKTGRKVVYHPSVTIIHDWQRATTGKFLSPMARKHIKALIYFYKKWGRWF